MSDAHPAIGNVAQNQGLQFLQVLDAVVHEEHLSVSAHLEIDGLGDDFLVERMYLRLDGITVGRWCLDNRQIPGSHQRELQGTRNGRSGHGQRIHVHLELAELLFHAHPEFLFFVDDQQAQVLELHTLADELMGTYQHLDFSIGQLLQDARCILGRTGTTQVFHLAREFLQSFAERLIMLVGQHGGRHEYRHLLVVRSCLERSTHGYLRLSEAHIPAHQSVHRAVALHVGLHIVGRLQLVGRIFIEEARLQLMLKETIGRIGKALFLLALGI